MLNACARACLNTPWIKNKGWLPCAFAVQNSKPKSTPKFLAVRRMIAAS
jgi:hypothetical protein